MKLVYVGIAVFLCGAMAGAAINGWRIGEQKAAQKVEFLAQEVTESNDAFKAVNERLITIVDKTSEAAERSTQTLVLLQLLDKASNKQYALITANTQKVNDEISKLGIPKCTYSIEHGRMYEQIGEATNAHRGTLYGTESGNTD